MAEELLSGKPNLSEQTFPEAELFNPHDLVVVTNCYYPDYRKLNSLSREKEDISGIRGDLAIQLITETLDLGAHMVVSVSQCSEDFMSELNTLRKNGLIIVNSDSPDRAPQRRIAFHAAGLKYPQAKLILYTQAEKTGLIKDIQAFCEPILNDKADVIVLSRDTGIFENSYPKYLWESETRVNKVYNWVLRKKSFMDANPKVQPDFDWFFGPFLFKRELLPLFLEQYELFDSITIRKRGNLDVIPNPEKHSGSHYFPLIKALSEGKRVVSLPVQFTYPQTQNENETSPINIDAFIKRRHEDAVAYLLEALHFIAYLRNKPSKIKRLI